MQFSLVMFVLVLVYIEIHPKLCYHNFIMRHVLNEILVMK